MEKTSTSPMPSPSDIAYIDDGIFAYLMDVLRERKVTYQSPACDLIYNEVIKDVRKRICASIQPK